MATELLEIQPRDLKFVFELKKHSSSSMTLINNSELFVAFKVKTTQPKKYCVRPNSGLVKPKSSYDFTVTMQAQKVAPPDMKCKDKFLIQSTIVPLGTFEEEITSDVFAKESGKYIEERKIRVVLVSPDGYPASLPINGGQNKEPSPEPPVTMDRVPSGAEIIPPPQTVSEDMEEPDAEKVPVNYMEETNEVESRHLPFSYEDELKIYQDRPYLDFPEDLEELKSRLRVMCSKLKEAEHTIEKLTEEKRATNREKDKLKRELELLRSSRTKTVQVGFPLLYVCAVAVVSLFFGYLSRT